MYGFFIKANGFKHLVRLVKNCAAGSFVYAAALHTHKPVFHNVKQAYTVFAAQLIKGINQLYGAHFLAVNRRCNALFKVERYIGRLIGCHFGGYAHFKEAGLVVLRLVFRVFKVKSLVG